MAKTLRDFLTYIMENYDTSQPFIKNKIAKTVRSGITDIPAMGAIESSGFKLRGSSGQGAWAEVPWIGLFDTHHFEASAQVGIYLVYLFAADHKRVYLSLDQAWTSFKNNFGGKQGKIELLNSTKLIRQTININSYIDNPVYDISLGGHTDNPRGYELGNIASVEYHLDNMPEEQQLLSDLASMKNLLINTINKLNIYIDDENITYSVNTEKTANSIAKVPTLKKLKYTPAEETPHTQLKGPIFDPSNTVKKDYVKETKRNSSTGEYGENMVVKLEQEKLKKCGKSKLAKKVEHVSKTQGDGTGYDIKSFDEKGNEIYIEVKSTTSSDRDSAFNISANEIKASEYYGDSYYLYRLYDISNIHEHPKYYKIQGNLKEKLHLVTTSFIASPK